MLFLKPFFKNVLAFILFISISGFSGIANYTTHLKQTQTEFVLTNKNISRASINYCDILGYTSYNISLNQYTAFNFKSFLKNKLLNFNIVLKTLKQRTYEFLDINSTLEQNIIAYKNTSHTNHAFVK